MSYLSQELPKELKEFGKVFDSIAYKHSYNNVFYDFIDYQVACFLFNGNPDLAKRLEKQYGDDYPKFRTLFEQLLLAHQESLSSQNWYDGLGIVYETITSKFKSSRMGQFFTPPSIVELMVQLNLESLKDQKRKTISDPACGSGRLLIAAHAFAPGNYQFGQDLDQVCAKMTAINMVLHGCVGEVACMNTITMEWFFSYDVNTYLSRYGVPTLNLVEKFEDSTFYVDYNKPEKQQIIEVQKVEIIEKKIEKSNQLSLF